VPKLKTHRGAAKRLKRNGGGTIIRGKAGKRHLLTGKSRTQKRRMRQSEAVDSTNIKHAQKLLPYGK
jgi:large subunit ribosomal protein L35